MSMPFEIYSCTKCGFKLNSYDYWGNWVYQNEGKRVGVKRHIAWCEDCEKFVPAEVLPSLQGIIELMLRREEWGKSATLFERLHIRPEHDRYELLKDRTTPPRCLECGSTRITYLPDWQRPEGSESFPPMPLGFVHPGCGGEIMVESPGSRIRILNPDRVYDLDGNRVNLPSP